MKPIYLLTLTCLFVIQTICLGSLYFFPKTKRPQIPLKEACVIAENMLKAKGFDQTFYATDVSLFGDENGSGEGAWNLSHHDKDGNHINAYIPFPSNSCNLHYYPANYSKSGGGHGDYEINFVRDGTKVTAEQSAPRKD